MQTNQEKLSLNIKKQNSISLNVIDKFNDAIRKLNHNDKLLQEKIDKIAKLVQYHPTKEYTILFKDVLIQIIKLYKLNYSIL